MEAFSKTRCFLILWGFLINSFLTVESAAVSAAPSDAQAATGDDDDVPASTAPPSSNMPAVTTGCVLGSIVFIALVLGFVAYKKNINVLELFNRMRGFVQTAWRQLPCASGAGRTPVPVDEPTKEPRMDSI